MPAKIIATGRKLALGLRPLLQQTRELADLPGVLATVFTIPAQGILMEIAVFTPIQRRVSLRRGLTETR
jgi:NitT/TauT family transport system permease protein